MATRAGHERFAQRDAGAAPPFCQFGRKVFSQWTCINKTKDRYAYNLKKQYHTPAFYHIPSDAVGVDNKGCCEGDSLPPGMLRKMEEGVAGVAIVRPAAVQREVLD